MSTATTTEPIVGELVVVDVKSLPIKFNVTDAMLSELKDRYSGLKVVTKDDYELAKAGKRTCIKFRTGSDARKEELIRPALDYQEQVRSVHKSIHAAVREVEDSLEKEIAKYDEIEAERKRKIAEEKRAAVEKRIAALMAVESVPHSLIVEAWSDEQFATELEAATNAYTAKKLKAEQEAAEAARIAAEQAEALRIEQEKLAAERAELERFRAEETARQQAEADRLRAEEEYRQKSTRELQAKIDESNRIEREEIESQRRALQAEKDRIEQEEFQRQETIRLEREAAEKAERDRLESERLAAEEAETKRIAEVNAAIERKRIESMRPDAEKLQVLADTLRLLSYPEMGTSEGKAFLENVVEQISTIANHCESFIAS